MRIGWLLLAGLPLMACATAVGPSVSPISPSTVAGAFYPADPARLRAAIDGYLGDAVASRSSDPVAIVVPHAGFVFSGPIAADGYRQLAGRTFDTVVILGANHTGRGDQRMAVYDGPDLLTPLGSAVVDRALAAAIVNEGIDAVFDSSAHEGEHSIAVQIPFVQTVLPHAKIVPIVVGPSDAATCARFGRALAKTLEGRRTVLVASSDLSHYPAQPDAVVVDAHTLEAVASLDPNRLGRAFARTDDVRAGNLATRACGEGAIRVVMEAARSLGATRGTVVSYANSGDTVLGEPGRVVGYGAVVFSRGEERGSDVEALARAVPDATRALDAADRRLLLRLARETISRYLASDTVPLPRGGSSRLLRESGVFVTLKKHGELRGCIGRLQAQGTLVRLVSAMAFESAFRDPRFEPVRAGELGEIDIEVSVLTPPRQVAGPGAIAVGRDGVILRLGDRSAVFLPQVATEQKWNREQLLDNLALKAGLPTDAWRGKTAQLLTFQADVFSEATLR
ncbi:MAG: AmmeMemoRadiSam system protein B [Acidobacteria bacterium]|nr:AmmeMemoRadiSam system protein B [Acidobacteriota bacterium]